MSEKLSSGTLKPDKHKAAEDGYQNFQFFDSSIKKTLKLWIFSTGPDPPVDGQGAGLQGTGTPGEVVPYRASADPVPLVCVRAGFGSGGPWGGTGFDWPDELSICQSLDVDLTFIFA